MPRRKQARRTTVQDIRAILRLTHEQGLSASAVLVTLNLRETAGPMGLMVALVWL